MENRNNKGFTLAELLIVVAIIAVLTAVAIPVFGNSLEKAKEATDVANLRAAYAECANEALLSSKPTYKTVAMTQGKTGWVDGADYNIGGLTGSSLDAASSVLKNSTINVYVDTEGNVTISNTAPTLEGTATWQQISD